MSIFSKTAQSAVITLCAVAAMGAVPAGSASGAIVLPEQVVTAPLPPVPVIESRPGDGIATNIVPTVETVVAPPGASLAQLVGRFAGDQAGDRELNCLANAVYFESKGEPLAGQLAVAKVVMNRTTSGRFASTICGVVKQPSQFSFVRGGGFPAAPNTAQWRQAVGVAPAAMKGL